VARPRPQSPASELPIARARELIDRPAPLFARFVLRGFLLFALGALGLGLLLALLLLAPPRLIPYSEEWRAARTFLEESPRAKKICGGRVILRPELRGYAYRGRRARLDFGLVSKRRDRAARVFLFNDGSGWRVIAADIDGRRLLR